MGFYPLVRSCMFWSNPQVPPFCPQNFRLPETSNAIYTFLSATEYLPTRTIIQPGWVSSSSSLSLSLLSSAFSQWNNSRTLWAIKLIFCMDTCQDYSAYRGRTTLDQVKKEETFHNLFRLTSIGIFVTPPAFWNINKINITMQELILLICSCQFCMCLYPHLVLCLWFPLFFSSLFAHV